MNDSIQGKVADVGTGAGFPGIVLKIVFPNLKITLLSKDRDRCKDWYFGHFHEDVDVENFHCRIDEVTQIE